MSEPNQPTGGAASQTDRVESPFRETPFRESFVNYFIAECAYQKAQAEVERAEARLRQAKTNREKLCDTIAIQMGSLRQKRSVHILELPATELDSPRDVVVVSAFITPGGALVIGADVAWKEPEDNDEETSE